MESMGFTEEDVTSIANKLPDEIEKMKMIN